MTDRASVIPMRLTDEERSLLHVLEGALQISEYTDKVDVINWRLNKSDMIRRQLDDLFAVLSGLMVAANSGRAGRELVHDREFRDNAAFFQRIFEIGRRFKCMNPDRMRSCFGKLVHLLQDARQPEIQRELGFSCLVPVLTVRRALEADDLGEVLDDADLAAATKALRPGEAAARKAEATERLVARHAAGDAARGELVRRAVLSIADDEALTAAHVAPVSRMLALLREHFDPQSPDANSTLAIQAGRGGARLSHSHATQFAYVEQSLRLWEAILSELPRLWSLAEADLLGGNGYRLRDTGQGAHRVQSAPHVGEFMRRVLGALDAQVGGRWIGSSAVHLGDNDVPNAMVWLDKYVQVPRIVEPVVAVVDGMEAAGPEGDYVAAAFGSVDACKKLILGDFFRHAFDGSGADNFYDAGSCIDGRLTSAWNWGSKLAKKPYVHVFHMLGFRGFDGSFDK